MIKQILSSTIDWPFKYVDIMADATTAFLNQNKSVAVVQVLWSNKIYEKLFWMLKFRTTQNTSAPI